MNLQIIGTKKCAETRKAERFFKERGVAFHFRDLRQKGLSSGELRNIANAVGGAEHLVDVGSKEYERRKLRWIRHDPSAALTKYPGITKTPIVRNGGKATVGHRPEVWKRWLEEG